MADVTVVPCDGTIRAPPAWLLSGQAFFAGWVAADKHQVSCQDDPSNTTLQVVLVGQEWKLVHIYKSLLLHTRKVHKDTLSDAIHNEHHEMCEIMKSELRYELATFKSYKASKTSVKIVPILKSVWRQHGIHGLLRGITYPLVSFGAANAAFFCTSEYTRNFMIQQGWTDKAGKLTYAQILLVGGIGGLAQVPIVCPTELVKIKLQHQMNTGRRLYTGSIDCTIKLWKVQGVAGFFRGLSVCTFRDIYPFGFYLVIFEFSGDKMSDMGLHHIASELVAGGLAGSGSWAIAIPLDVIKSRIQASDHKLRFIPVVKSLYAEEGWRAFTRGLLAASIRGFPVNAVTLCGFTEIMRRFNAFNSYYN